MSIHVFSFLINGNTGYHGCWGGLFHLVNRVELVVMAVYLILFLGYFSTCLTRLRPVQAYVDKLLQVFVHRIYYLG